MGAPVYECLAFLKYPNKLPFPFPTILPRKLESVWGSLSSRTQVVEVSRASELSNEFLKGHLMRRTEHKETRFHDCSKAMS